MHRATHTAFSFLNVRVKRSQFIGVQCVAEKMYPVLSMDNVWMKPVNAALGRDASACENRGYAQVAAGGE
jgi:hypothetical protein